MISFGNPWGALALLALPAIVGLHLLRRRRTERRVAGLHLFAEELRATPAGRRVEPLRRSLSLFLELAAAALFAFLVAQPRLSDPDRPEHAVVVLDDSASMSAVPPSGSVLARAKAAVSARIDGGAALVTLLRTGPRPELLAGPRVPPAEARAALARWTPSQPGHDVRASLAFAAEIAGPKGRVLFVTDRDSIDVPPTVDLEAVGGPAANAAIVSAVRDARGATESVRLSIRAFSAAPLETEVRLSVRAGDASRELAAKSLRLEAGATVELAVDVPSSDLPIVVRLGPDALGIDSEAILLPTPRRVVPIAWTLEESAAKRLGLARLPTVLDDVVLSKDAASAALVVASDDGPPPPGGARLVVAAPGTERDDWLGPFLRERRDPLLEGVTLEGVLWTAGRGAVGGRPLVSASGEPLLLRDETPDGLVVRWNLDLARSTVPSSPDGPILLANLVEEVRRGLPGVVEPNVRLGATLLLRHAYAAATSAAARLVRPSGRTAPLRGRRLAEWDAEEPGLHRLEGVPGPAPTWSVAFVDPLESDLLGAHTLSRPASAAGRSPDRGPRAEESTLLGASGIGARIALLLLLLVATAAWRVGARGAAGGGP